MKRIVVASLHQAKDFRPEPGERYAVLSFVDPGTPGLAFPRHPGFVAQIIVYAHDSSPAQDYNDAGVQEWKSLTVTQARRIATFVHRIAPQIDTLLVHCVARLSRSPAAAQAISEALGITEVTIYQAEAIPNRHVLALVSAALAALKA